MKKTKYKGYMVKFKQGVVDSYGILSFEEQKRAFINSDKADVLLTDADYELLSDGNSVKMKLKDLDLKGMIT